VLQVSVDADISLSLSCYIIVIVLVIGVVEALYILRLSGSITPPADVMAALAATPHTLAAVTPTT
jgi:hypothetical protein